MLGTNPRQFSLRDLLALTAGIGVASTAGLVGGSGWFLFGLSVVASAVLLRTGFRWALHGSGYWPHGIAGELLTITAVLVMPFAMIASALLIIEGIGRQPQFWFPLPPLSP